MCRLQRDNGDIRVRGFETDTFKAGRMEICHQGQWWEVCDDGWDRNSAQTVCKQLGFTEGKCGQNRVLLCTELATPIS